MLLPLLFSLLFISVVNYSNQSEVRFTCLYTNGDLVQCPKNARPSTFTSELIAYVKFSNRINATGWAELELTTNNQQPDPIQAYYAGYLEGFVTARLISSTRHNMIGKDEEALCRNFTSFINDNLNYTMEMVVQNLPDPYWQQVALALYQLAGLDDGYAAGLNSGLKRTPPEPHMHLDPCGVILINLSTEYDDLKAILNIPNVRSTHCSAIVKLVPQSSDVLVAHNTWTTFSSMLRILKRYNLNFSTSQATSVAMSSYPGVIYSIDDFYITSQQLVVLETSLENFNQSLYRGITAQGIVFQFIRNTVANRLAQNGFDWIKFYSRYNSGTYNNQFMIVDYKQIGKPEGLLTVLEQLPTVIVFADKTKHLLKTGYWPSYNVPYFDVIYNISEQPKMVNQYGDFYSYDKTARALIFARDHVKVANVSSLFHLMRYNDMFHDPLSRCNCSPPYTGEYAIAARCDLNDPKGRYPIMNLSFRPHGAIDAKMTSSKLVRQLQMVAVSGPTDENVPAFSWARTKITDQPHVDHPQGEWRFKPVKTVWGKNEVFPQFNFDL